MTYVVVYRDEGSDENRWWVEMMGSPAERDVRTRELVKKDPPYEVWSGVLTLAVKPRKPA